MPSNSGWVGQWEAPAVGGCEENEVRVFFSTGFISVGFLGLAMFLLKAIVPDRRPSPYGFGLQ